jgi:hypothetical protein
MDEKAPAPPPGPKSPSVSRTESVVEAYLGLYFREGDTGPVRLRFRLEDGAQLDILLTRSALAQLSVGLTPYVLQNHSSQDPHA